MKTEYKEVWDLYAEKYIEKDYILKEVLEVYWPVWKCQQSIVLNTNTSLDGFSQVILQTIEAGCSSHVDICAFLGIGEDSFVLGQFHYLLKQDWARMSGNTYWLTPKGKDLLEHNTKVEQLKTIDFEFYTLESTALKNAATNLHFFDSKKPINKDWSKAKQNTFKGYRIYQNNRLNKNTSAQIMRHHQNQVPSLIRLKEQRNDFAAFVQQCTGKTFYDFGNVESTCHSHSLCFLALSYQKKGDPKSIRTDIRQSPKSVLSFSGFELEEKL